MKRKHVPSEDGRAQLPDHAPHDRSCPLGDCWSQGRAINRQITPKGDAEISEICLVGKCDSGTATTAISKVAPDPNCVDLKLYSGLKLRCEIRSAPCRRIGQIEVRTFVGIWIEYGRKPQARERLDELNR
jgi:hypothetical protein